MSRVRPAIFAMLLAASCGLSAFAAGPLDAVFAQIDAVPWGAGQEAARQGMPAPPILGNTEVMLAASGLAGRPATANYLFAKSGGLYDVAWFAATPLDDFAAAIQLDRDLEEALRACYGEPLHSRSYGDPVKAKEARANAAKVREAVDRVALLTGEHNGKLSPAEAAALFADKEFLASVPAVFYGRLLFWDGGGEWIFSSLSCSTDGTCAQQLHFAAKKLAGDGYTPAADALAGYSPLDRDQDMVTKINRTWEAEKRKGAETRR